MILPLLLDVTEFGFALATAFLFLSLTLAMEVGYRVGQLRGRKDSPRGAGYRHLHAGDRDARTARVHPGLSISFAQNRYEACHGLVLAEANAIVTAWLRTKLIDGDEGPAIAAKIEDYAKVRLKFTTTTSDNDVPALVAKTNALQNVE